LFYENNINTTLFLKLLVLLFSVSQSFSKATCNGFSLFSNGEILIDTNVYSYEKNKITVGGEVYLPFEFSKNDAERDLGIVILGSVYPTRKERRFSFPLYAGFGYFLNEDCYWTKA
jgi:hypothetical protein